LAERKTTLSEPKETTAATLAVPLTVSERIDQIFPTLNSEQIARVAAHGRKRQIQSGEILTDVGDPVRFFLVTAGTSTFSACWV